MLRRGLLVALVGCHGGARETRPPSSTPIPVGGIADAGPIAAEAEPAVLAAPPPSDVACTLAPNDVQLELAFDGEGPGFASIVSATGALSVPLGPPARGAFFEHAAGGIRLRGWVRSTSVDLYAKKPLLFAGWLVPSSSTKLRWIAAKPGALELRLELDRRDDESTTVTFHDVPRADVRCDDVALTYADEFDGVAFLLRGRTGAPQRVRAGEPIPISVDPDRPPVAEIQFSHADIAEVTVVERRGGAALVVVDAWGPATLRGWISDAFFGQSPVRLGRGRSVRSPIVRMGTTDERDRRTVSCERPVRIVAELAGRRAYAGEIDARTPFVFVVDERRDGFRELVLEHVYVAKAARLVADRAVLDACAPVTPRR